MTNEMWLQVDQKAKQWVREAGSLLSQSFTNKLKIDFKSNPDDLVTEMDHKIEQFFISKIKKHYPDHLVLGEEGFGDEITSLDGTVWIIDPIDGTMNFVHQQRHFAISVAVYHNGEGILGLIYDVVGDDLYHARKGNGAYLNDSQLPPLEEVKVERAIIGMNATWVTPNKRIDPHRLSPVVTAVRGVRSYGSAAIELAFVAAGILDAYITLRLSPWDFAAGLVLIEEVGGTVTTLEGKELHLLGQNTILASKRSLHKQLLNEVIIKEDE